MLNTLQYFYDKSRSVTYRTAFVVLLNINIIIILYAKIAPKYLVIRQSITEKITLTFESFLSCYSIHQIVTIFCEINTKH